MPTVQGCLAIRWIERAVLLLGLLFLCGHTLPRAWRTLNTDFPNYYTAARLVHEGYDTSRMYEWTWIEREKDHRAIDIRVIGLLPITPFSTLAVWPLAHLAPLAAKHAWILLNLVFLIPLGWMLQSMTGLGYRRIALVLALSFPLHRNLLYGQFYILLLLLIAAACWSYLRGLHSMAGVLLAIAAMCKIFPVLLFAFFLQRREWRTLVAGIITGLAAIAISIATFGWNAHRTWLLQILPWVTRGEGMPPYTVSSASFSSLLHRLFLFEPQWNPHPWHSSPLAFSLLLPLLQMATLAPAILLIEKENRSRSRVLLEWSALLTASLAISTIPASYNFVLMAFPACVVIAALLRQKQYGWLAVVIVSYLGIGLPVPDPHSVSGLWVLPYMPRLPLMLTMLFAIYRILWQDSSVKRYAHDWGRFVWGTAMLASVLWSIFTTFRVEQAEQQELAYRVPLQMQGLLNASPQQVQTEDRYIAFTFNGYQLVTQDSNTISSDVSKSSMYDDLSFTSEGKDALVEHSQNGSSQIVRLNASSKSVVQDAHDPMLSANGADLAFIRDDHGQGRLMLRHAYQSTEGNDIALSPRHLNVYEASFRSDSEYAFAATENDASPQIFLTDEVHNNVALPLGTARYPALSPDSRWLAYSHLDHGMWNLWVRDQQTGQSRRIVNVPCNQIQPSWEADSKTLLYSTDCGRSLWFTAVARRRVIP